MPGKYLPQPAGRRHSETQSKAAGLNWIVESAGTGNYNIGSAPHHLSQKVAKQNGIDICEQRARLFKKEFMQEYDKIYVMDLRIFRM